MQTRTKEMGSSCWVWLCDTAPDVTAALRVVEREIARGQPGFSFHEARIERILQDDRSFILGSDYDGPVEQGHFALVVYFKKPK